MVHLRSSTWSRIASVLALKLVVGWAVPMAATGTEEVAHGENRLSDIAVELEEVLLLPIEDEDTTGSVRSASRATGTGSSLATATPWPGRRPLRARSRG
jgi:hypothetical protein